MQEYKGFSLFNDVEDVVLRNSNRARVLTNMACTHSKNQRISPGGAGLILGYYNQLPEEDKKDVQEKFIEHMKKEGFILVC